MANINAYKAINEDEQLRLTVREGDICARLDENKLYMALNDNARSMADWRALLTLEDAVTSVDGQTGEVSLGGEYVSQTDDVVRKSGDDDIRGSKKFFGPLLSYHGQGEGEYGADRVSLGNDNVSLREIDGKAKLDASGDIELDPGPGGVTKNLGHLDVAGNILLNGTINGVDVTSLRGGQGQSGSTTTASGVTSVDGQSGAVDLSGQYSPLGHTHSMTAIAEALADTFENKNNKGVAEGYASLDENGRLPDSQAPAGASKVHSANNQSSQLSLEVKPGDICERDDEGKAYIALNALNNSMDCWRELENYASLDDEGKVPKSQLPNLAFKVHRVDSEDAQLNLTINKGDVCVRRDIHRSYIAISDANDVMEDWQELLSPASSQLDPRVHDISDEQWGYLLELNQGLKITDDVSFNTINDRDPTVDGSKLDGIDDNANNYVHPDTHSADMILQTDNRSFVSNDEKTSWNNKQDALGFTPENSADKGRANGYASLDNDGKVPDDQLRVTSVDGRTGAVSLSDLYEAKDPDIQGHITQTTGNPHNVTKEQLNLGESDNVKFASVRVDGLNRGEIVEVNDEKALISTPKGSAHNKNFGYEAGEIPEGDKVVRLSGDQEIAGNKTFDDDVTIQGDLNVSGETTSIISQEVLIEDNILTLNSNVAGAPSEDSGLEIERGDQVNARLLWDESDDSWKAGVIGDMENLVLDDDSRLSDSRTCDNSFDNPDEALDALSLDRALKELSRLEITQLQNIDGAAVSGEQWGYLGELDQSLKTDGDVTHNSLALADLTPGHVVEVGSDNELISPAKNTAHNKNFGDAAGTVAEGDKVVRLSGDQEIAGNKTFANDVIVNGRLQVDSMEFVDQENITGNLTYDTQARSGLQSFTAGVTGALIAVSTKHSVESNPHCILKLYRGEGDDGDILQRQSIHLSLGIIKTVFDVPVPIVADQKYTIGIQADNTNDLNPVIWDELINGDVTEHWFQTHVKMLGVVSTDRDGKLYSSNLLPTGTEAQTQESGDNSDKIATTEYVDSGLSGKENSAGKGQADGYASLDATGKVPGAQLPDTLVKLSENQEIAGNKTFSDNVTIRGDLTVSGTTTTTIAREALIEDNILTLNSNATGLPSDNSGLEIERGDQAKARLLWDESGDSWKAGMVGDMENLVLDDDPRLSDSRKCDNSFDDPDAALDALSLDRALKNLVFSGLKDANGVVSTDKKGTLSSSSILLDGTEAKTQTLGDNSDKIATTEYVDRALGRHSTGIVSISAKNSLSITSNLENHTIYFATAMNPYAAWFRTTALIYFATSISYHVHYIDSISTLKFDVEGNHLKLKNYSGSPQSCTCSITKMSSLFPS